MEQVSENKTPWQKVFAKFGMSQRALGQALDRDGAKINRAIHDPDGFINGADQEKILTLAKSRGVDISPDDLVPSVNG